MLTNLSKKILLIVGSILLTVVISKNILSPEKGILETIASNITYPFIVISNKIAQPFCNYSSNKKNVTELQEKYSLMKNEYENLLVENFKLKSTINYEKISNDIIDFQERYELHDATLAKILAKNFSDEEHSFLVNRGKKDGIEKNMVAIYKFQIVGKVIEVDRWSSKILLITDRNCKIASYTNATYAQGIVVGKNKPNECQMQYVSYLAKVNLDDFIISSGQGLIFPEGFCLGKITKLTTKGLYHKIKLQPLIDLRYIDFCLLVNQEKITAF